jgi:hypothetical protein
MRLIIAKLLRIQGFFSNPKMEQHPLINSQGVLIYDKEITTKLLRVSTLQIFSIELFDLMNISV